MPRPAEAQHRFEAATPKIAAERDLDQVFADPNANRLLLDVLDEDQNDPSP